MLQKERIESHRQIFRFAIARDIASRNPAADFKPRDILAEAPTENRPVWTPRDLPELLAKMEDYNGDAITRFAMKLMAYTFVRTSEEIEAPWTEFDLDEARWTIPAERMKMKTPHIVPLSRQAVEVLRALKLLTGNGKFVFPGALRQEKAHQQQHDSVRALRLGYRDRMTGHGFRGLASTILNEQEFDEAHIELQLAHTKRNKVCRCLQPRKVFEAANRDDAMVGRLSGCAACEGPESVGGLSQFLRGNPGFPKGPLRHRLLPGCETADLDVETRSTAHCLTSDLTQATVRGPSRTGAGKLFARISA